MMRRSAVSVFVLVVSFALGMMLSNRPATVSAQPAAGRGKCIGMSVVHWGPGVPGDYRAFRAFEDGTVEMTEQQGPENSTVWVKVGK